MSHVVYRLFAEDGTLLYIGSTEDIDKRLGLHMSTTTRLDSRVRGWETIHRRYHHHTVEPHPHRDAAREAERNAIRSERPLLNVHFNTGKPYRPSKPRPVATVLLDEPGDSLGSRVGYELGRAMTAADYSTEQLAEAAQVPAGSLARMLLGRSNVPVSFYVRASEALGLRFSEVLERAEAVSA